MAFSISVVMNSAARKGRNAPSPTVDNRSWQPCAMLTLSPIVQLSITTPAPMVQLSPTVAGPVITTDGSISSREALASAGATLRALVQLVEEMSDEPQGLELGEVGTPLSSSPDMDLLIEDLDLSERPRNCLKRARVDTIGQLVMKTEDDLLAITNFGSKSLEEVIQKLDERGLSLRVKE